MFIYIYTNLVTMTFVHTILETIHAQDTRGVYCTVPKTKQRRVSA